MDEAINEFQLMDAVKLMIRIVHTGNIKTTNSNLIFKEYFATDDGKFRMKIAMFQQITDRMELNNTY